MPVTLVQIECQQTLVCNTSVGANVNYGDKYRLGNPYYEYKTSKDIAKGWIEYIIGLHFLL